MNNLLFKIKRKLPSPFKKGIRRLLDFYNWDSYFHKSWSQEGEDLVLQRFFEDRKGKGFFVDVGAHHPIRFSNTYKFYLKGWRGINIDAMPGSMNPFKKIRPLDINLEIAVSDKEEILTYFIFNEPALNTFSETEASLKDGLNDYKIIEKKQMQTQRLETILDKYLPKEKEIDFLSIDVEGLDYMVLISNNWIKYKPELILIEDLQSDIEQVISSQIYYLMKSKGYKLVARTVNTLFFRLK